LGLGCVMAGDWVRSAGTGAAVTCTGALVAAVGLFVAGASVTGDGTVGEAVNGPGVGRCVVFREIVGEAVSSGTAAGNGESETVVLLVAFVAGDGTGLDAGASDSVELSGSHVLGGFNDSLHIPCAIHSSYALTLAYTAGVSGRLHPSPKDTTPTCERYRSSVKSGPPIDSVSFWQQIKSELLISNRYVPESP
jgi:hypothetical protein